MPQSLSSGVSDMRLMHHDSTEVADPLLGMVKLAPVRVFLQPTSISNVTTMPQVVLRYP